MMMESRGTKKMTTYRYTIILDRQPDGGFHAYCPALRGCHSQGDSLEEATDNMREADGALHGEPPMRQRAVLDALEARFPMLRGTIRDHSTQKRRPFVRFFACQRDLSLDSPDTPLPDAVATGEEPFMVVGAIAGG